MKSKKVSVTEYATLRGISRQAVLKAIVKGYKMPLVISCVKVGNNWILKVNTESMQ